MLTLRRTTSKILPSHVAKSIMAIQRAGIAVTDIKREVVVDALNRYDVYSIKLIPLEGQECTIRFPIRLGTARWDLDGCWCQIPTAYATS